jgi:autophagy-related protein 11
VSATCHELLLNVASIQSVASPVNPQINKMDEAFQEEDGHFQLLSLITRLPASYGSLLIECVRRREWSERFQSNNQKLAEDLAVMKEDEEKRRRKWQRSTGLMLPFELTESQVLRAELTTRGDATGGLPKVNRQDVEAYVTSLKAVGSLDDAVKELTQALQEIDKPSKRLNKRLKGFKMGSIHEAGMMGSSVLSGRNDDEIKQLRTDKEQLGERIKGYESRIRKLEDLLHRGRTANGNPYPPNSQPGRPSTPGIPQPFPSTPAVQSPHSPEQQIVKPVIPHRRSSSEQNSIEAYKARISALVAELAAEKERATELQKAASQNTEAEKAMNAQILQADETKRDLVANLDATLQQHISERKALTAEIEELTRKLESAEEELDRIEEEKVRPLEHELELVGGELSHHREELEKEMEKSRVLTDKLTVIEREKNDEIMQLRSELEDQIQRVDEESQRAEEAEAALTTSEKSVTRMAEEISKLEKQLKDARDALDTERLRSSSNQTSLFSVMKLAHGHLSADKPPEDANALMNNIETMISKVVARNKELKVEIEAEKASTTSLKGEKEFLQNRFDSRTLRAKDLTQRLYTHNARSIQLLESLGYKVVRGDDSMQIVKVSRSNSNNESTVLAKSTMMPADATQKASPPVAEHPSVAEDLNLLYWMESPDSDTESEKYSQYIKTIVAFDLDAFSETITNRVKKAEQDARHLMKQGRAYREKYYRARDEAGEKIAFKSFKAGDLALFLPTRNQATRPWAAFNVGAPHFFLREQDSHKLASRDWLLARISKVEERVVDLSRSTASVNLPYGIERSSVTSSDAASFDDENPFELSDGLRWYLLDATEEKAGAPTTPGLSSSTVASANVDAKGSLRSRKPITGAKKKLSEITTEHSRRSSSGSQNRSSVALSPETIKAAVEGGGAQESVFVESVPNTPRTPVEKIVATVRSRAASIRSMTPAPEQR